MANNPYALCASDVDNPSESVSTKTKTLGRFPGVVSFYHSDNQREGKYGSEDNVGIPRFGYDIYLPRLYGVSNTVKGAYKKSNHVVTGYQSDKEGGKVGEIVNKYVFPRIHEMVHDTARVPFTSAKEYDYHCPWLKPGLANEMRLSVYVNYPDPLDMSPEDEFIMHKDTAETDKDIEKIYFKLVKVSSEWQPVEIEAGKCNYYSIDQEIPLTEAQQNERNSLPQKEAEINALQTEIDGFEQREADIITEIKSIVPTLNLNYSDVTGTAIDESEINGLMTYTYGTTSSDIGNLMNYVVGMLNRRVALYNKGPKTSVLKTEMDRLRQFHYKNKAFAGEKATLNAKIADLKTKKEALTAINNRIKIEDNFREADITLNISGNRTFDFAFRTASKSERQTNVTITKSGENKKAALIAYYVRSETINDTEVTREFIIGQVNILPADHHISVETKYEEEIQAEKINMLFNPMPIHFVKVILKKQRQTLDGNIEEGKIIAWGDELNGGNYQGIVDNANEYFQQAGIKFQMLRMPIVSAIEVPLVRKEGRDVLRVEGTDFEVKGNDDYRYMENTQAGRSELLNKLQQSFKRHLMNNVLYDKSKAPDSLKGEDVFERCHTTEKGATIPPSERYMAFLNEFPELCPKKESDSLFGSKKDDWELIWKRARGIASYLVENINLVFLVRNINWEEENRKRTWAYAMRGLNGVLMYGIGISDWENTLPHELGHALGLEHTFHNSLHMYPDKVLFLSNDAEWARKRGNIDAQGDSTAYAATYCNVMDYESDVNDAEKNTTFKRQIFVKSQWDKMIGNLKGKSYLTTIQRGYKTEPEFYSTNPYLTGSNKEEMYNFINALNDFLR